MQHPDLKELDESIDRAVAKREMLVHRLSAFQQMVKDAKIHPATAEFPHARVRYYIPFLLPIDSEDVEYVEGYKNIIARHIPDMTYEACRLFNHDASINDALMLHMTVDLALAVDADLIKLCTELIDGLHSNLINASDASKIMPGDSGVVLLYELYCIKNNVGLAQVVPTTTLIHVKANKKRDYVMSKYMGDDGTYKDAYIHHLQMLPRRAVI